MDKTDKPLPKQPLSFPTSSLSSQDHPAKRNEENDTDALFAGLFEENIQDIRKTPQELQPSQTEHTIETEQATVPTLPPYSLSETWWEMSSSTQAHSAQEQEHPTPSNAPSTLVNAHQAAPNALDRSENSLQDLIAVLEQDISSPTKRTGRALIDSERGGEFFALDVFDSHKGSASQNRPPSFFVR